MHPSSLASFLLLLGVSITFIDATEVSDSYTIEASSTAFSKHFPQSSNNANLSPLISRQQGKEGTNLMFICHKAKGNASPAQPPTARRRTSAASVRRGIGARGRRSARTRSRTSFEATSNSVSECHYGTIYHKTKRIPLFAVKFFDRATTRRQQKKDEKSSIQWNDPCRTKWDFTDKISFNSDSHSDSNSVKMGWFVGKRPIANAKRDSRSNAGWKFKVEGDVHRGHMLANAIVADIQTTNAVYADGAKSTYSLYNIVPQFQASNTGKWLSIEHAARQAIEQCDHKYYLVASVKDYDDREYNCMNCQMDLEYTYNSKKDNVRQKCCKVAPKESANNQMRLSPNSVSFPETMWMAGCCYNPTNRQASVRYGEARNSPMLEQSTWTAVFREQTPEDFNRNDNLKMAFEGTVCEKRIPSSSSSSSSSSSRRATSSSSSRRRPRTRSGSRTRSSQ